jgi:hypothetical protein
MPWMVGIDEAGYGPNLGPLVMTAVACRVPEELAGADLWQVLHSVVRRHGGRDDGRLVIDDSKLVHTSGLGKLEAGFLAAMNSHSSPRLADCLDQVCSGSHAELKNEPWYDGNTVLPIAAGGPAVPDLSRAHPGVSWTGPRSVVICPRRFNELLDRHGSKAAVLVSAFGDLLAGILDGDGSEPMSFHIDKHGGRNFYGAMLQDLVPDGMVLAVEEGPERSIYRVMGRRELAFTFQPRADAAHLCVALASMISKYLREVLMIEFNAFWRRHLPDLKPTAGYPQDARRFFTAIQPVAAQLGIDERALWRMK